MKTNRQGVLIALCALIFTALLVLPLRGLIRRAKFPAAGTGGGGPMYWSISPVDLKLFAKDAPEHQLQISQSGRRVLSRSPRSRGYTLTLWDDALGVTDLVPEDLNVGESHQLAADGLSALFLASHEPGSWGLFLWTEGAGIRAVLPPILAGGWNFTASADLSSLLLIPIDSAAIQGAIAGISDYHGGVIRLVLSDEPDAQTAAPRRSVEFSASELFRPPSLVASSVNAVVARDSRGDLKRYLRGARLPVEDVDGDALSDLFLFQTGSAATWSSLTTGGVDGPGNAVTGKSARTYSFAFGQPEGVPVPGDYNGDGFLDLATFTPGFAPQAGATPFNWFIANSRPAERRAGNVSSPRNSVARYYWGNGADKAVPGDYDGDGRTDIAVFTSSGGMWSLLYSGGKFNQAKAALRLRGFGDVIQFGLPGDIPVPADYDGDGRTDLAVVRTATDAPSLAWLIRLSAAPNEPPKKIELGLPGDILLPADYDGDGKADPAVLERASSGASVWKISLSGGGAVSEEWCALPGLPLTGDFDGDGRADLGCFTPGSDEPWHILLSSFTPRGRELFAEKGPANFAAKFGGGAGTPPSILLREHQARVR